MIAFIDIEASSLSEHSYPIEVAWVMDDGLSESHLVKPQPTWTDWAADSALVHGIALADLAAHGVPAPDVARRLLAVLAGHDVYSDAPEADQIWLGALMRTASLPAPPLLHVYDAYRPIFRPLVVRLPQSVAASLARSIAMQAENETERLPGVRHRAEPDARRLYDTWRRVKVWPPTRWTDGPSARRH